MQRIIYKDENGKAILVCPTPDAIRMIGLTAIADKDVPHGTPYKIFNTDEIPEDLDSWDVPDEILTDGVGADWGVGSKNVVIAYLPDGIAVTRLKPT